VTASLGGVATGIGSASADLRRFFFTGVFPIASPAGLAREARMEAMQPRSTSDQQKEKRSEAHLTAMLQCNKCCVQQVAEIGHEDGAEAFGQRRRSGKQHRWPATGRRASAVWSCSSNMPKLANELHPFLEHDAQTIHYCSLVRAVHILARRCAECRTHLGARRRAPTPQSAGRAA
jgi:hypothetical protein